MMLYYAVIRHRFGQVLEKTLIALRDSVACTSHIYMNPGSGPCFCLQTVSRGRNIPSQCLTIGDNGVAEVIVFKPGQHETVRFNFLHGPIYLLNPKRSLFAYDFHDIIERRIVADT